MTEPRPEKIAILGGGMGALSAAFELTSVPGWRERYEVTVYQLGWRLGGKGASGRNEACADRIEEHGLHVWMGFYENAFKVMRECYAELGRAPSQPLATWKEAFHPHSYVVWEDLYQGTWSPWPVRFPTNGQEPGEGGELPPPWTYVRMAAEWALELFEDSPLGVTSSNLFSSIEGVLEEIPDLRGLFADLVRGPAPGDANGPLAALHDLVRAEGVPPASLFLHLARFLAERTDPLAEGPGGAGIDAFAALLKGFRAWLYDEAKRDAGLTLRRLFTVVDLCIGNTLGMIESGLIFPWVPWTSIDDKDYRAWLAPHCLSPDTPDSAPVRAFYCLVFSVEGGIAAGSTLVCATRMLFTYKGAIFYKMQAGMGDTVFTPLYEVLKRRGVSFEFFQRVDRLGVDRDTMTVSTIDITVQATTVDGAPYDPLIPVKGLACWPSTPRYHLLRQGQELRDGDYDLESAWTNWRNVGTRRLERGVHFDKVVLGISIGAFPYVCSELMDASPAFASMVHEIGTTPTQAMQLWLSPTLSGLGWTLPSPVLTSYAEPYDTWADMSQLLVRETWRAPEVPHNVAYFCGQLCLEYASPPPGPLPEYPLAMQTLARETAVKWLTANTGALWPAATLPTNPNELNWSLLVGGNATGPARFDDQFWVANVNPTDRYVQTLPGKTQYRLRAHESGFSNVFLAGDWVRTRLNGGCIEAATMGGMQASRAICGHPQRIVGDEEYPYAPPPAPTGTNGMPRYIDRGGNLILRQPFMQSQTYLSAYVLSANFDALVKLVDQCLNAPFGGERRYMPLAPIATLVCANIAHLSSLNAIDSQKGHMTEKDVGFWVPVAGGTTVNGVFQPDRLLWFLPYIFVDNAPAMATGREIYGFPKESGTLQLPRSPSDPTPVSADVIVIPTYSPETLAGPRRVVEVTTTAPPPAPPAPPDFESLVDLARAARALLEQAHATARDAIPWPLIANLMVEGFLGRMPMVFLQQFRDVEYPNAAAYQAIVEAPAVMRRFRGAGLLPGDQAVTVNSFASHPIATDLGLADSPIRPWMTTWVDFDFSMDCGTVIWSGGRIPTP